LPRSAWLFGDRDQISESERARRIAENERRASGADADGLLFLGKSAALTQSSFEPSIYLDPDYRKEMNRHAALGQDMEWNGPLAGPVPLTDSLVRLNSISPHYLHHY
jgi:hypothetical protein